MDLSEEEKELLTQYQNLSGSMTSLLKRLSVEIIPPIIFVGMGLYTGKLIWFFLIIALMVVYNVQRVLRQYKNIVKLRSISKKLIGSIDKNKT
ncbi:MAG: hypothetical protein GY760_28190 [Deltaproteobacteria bacterium]|nr:hypothetical protein [Deltaproteobacteria bacterium]